MTNQLPLIYYYLDEPARTVFHTEQEIEDRPDLVFIGSSTNPNKKMAMSVFMGRQKQESGFILKPLS